MTGTPTMPVKNHQRPAEPRPRWGVLRMLNKVGIGLFACSITYALFHYRRSMGHSQGGSGEPFPSVVIWSFCMAYVFGFFGISLFNTHAMEHTTTSVKSGGLYGTMCSREMPQVTYSSCSSSNSDGTNGGGKAFQGAPASPLPEVVACVENGKLKDHQLERKLGQHTRAVVVRRNLFERWIGRCVEKLLEGHDFECVPDGPPSRKRH